jgi:L-seryl-tRNA(Ser) seleniumtransferase
VQRGDQLRERAERFLERIAGLKANVIPGRSVVGGGSTPEQSLETWLIAIDCADVVEAERCCRSGDPPVVARIEDNRLLFDLRTVFTHEELELALAIRCLPLTGDPETESPASS